MAAGNYGNTFVFVTLLFFSWLSGLIPMNARKFEISDNMFWKDGQPFQIIGGDLHYFRILPQYWEDRLFRAKALGLNTIQTYVPWNLHQPNPDKFVFEGIVNITAFLEICEKLDLLVMLRVGPYICAEWDFGGLPPWLLAIEPQIKLRSADPAFLVLVERWWSKLFPQIFSHLYKDDGPIIMVQIENEYGSYGSDKAYLEHLVTLARSYLGNDIILYTTDGGSRENLDKGTLHGDMVYSAVDFTTGDDPWPIFELQKEFNAPGKSPPLSSEFYTGWLTHWGEKIVETSPGTTAAALDNILSRNGSVVLYMAHGGTNFGFYSGANTGLYEHDYKPDITSYDYDAPITESGDMNNAKFNELERVIRRYSHPHFLPISSTSEKNSYGTITLQKSACLFDLLYTLDTACESDDPLSMESVGQMFGFLLYQTEYSGELNNSTLYIAKVHDRAQVFIACLGVNAGRPRYIGAVERWSSQSLSLQDVNCSSDITLFILVENMGRVNYGQYMFDMKGILSPIYLEGRILRGWKMTPIPLHNLNDMQKGNSIIQVVHDEHFAASAHEILRDKFGYDCDVPAFYTGYFVIGTRSRIRDTFISFHGWGKGVAFVNGFNIGRFWPLRGPQCNLYVPAPILLHGNNTVVIFEVDSVNPDLVVESVTKPDFSCGEFSALK